MLRVVLAVMLVGGFGLPAGFGVPADAGLPAGAGLPEGPASAPQQPQIVGLYPDPVADGDDGEFVTLQVPPDAALDEFALADDDERVQLPSLVNVSASESVDSGSSDRLLLTFSTDPELTRSLTDRAVVSLPDRLQLSNSGETIRLLHDGRIVDRIRYEHAREGEVYDTVQGTWRPLGATQRAVVSAEGGTVDAFTLPDSPDRVIDLLDAADERILLAGYTLSSQRIVDTLQRARKRGVRVEILVDADPVGGMTGRAAGALDELSRTGIPVRVLGGERARYRYHHAKYAVVDGRALVTTENWKPAGVGGHSSRGWGVVTDQDRIVEGLAGLFHADTGWHDAIPWKEFDDLTLTGGERATETFPSNFENRTVPVERTELLVAPDNAGPRIHSAIDSAENSIDIKQVSVGDAGFPLLQALIDAAHRGVRVRILLSSAWYAERRNERLKTWLEQQATAHDLPLEVRLAQPDGSFEKIHAKGIIVDGRTTILGSINWNNNSLRRNREVVLLLEGREVAAYFGDVFEHDWDRGGWTVPVGYLLFCLVSVLVALLIAVDLRFERA